MKRAINRLLACMFALLLVIGCAFTTFAEDIPTQDGQTAQTDIEQSSQPDSDQTPLNNNDQAVQPDSEQVPLAEADLMPAAGSDLTVTFVTDGHATIDLYYSKDYTTPDETNVTSAFVRGKDSTDIDNSGNGQVNFKVNVEPGYSYTVTADPTANYSNCKGESDTGVADVYRVTKISGDVTVTIDTTADAPVEPPVSSEVTATEITADTIWSYTDDGVDPAQGLAERTAWTGTAYDDSAWKTGTGSFGAKKGAVSDLGAGCVPNTLLNQYKEDGVTDIEAFFFRTKVNIADASAVTSILGSLTYDDAATVYINGVKIAGFDDSSITDNIQYGGSNAGDPITVDISSTDTSMLCDGINTIAVEIHQGRSSSSDIYFYMPALTFSTEPVTADQHNISISMGADASQRNFTWYANADGEGTLRIAPASALVDGKMPESASVYTTTGAAATTKSGYYYYHLTASGLAGGTEYAYQVVNGSTESDISTFTTGAGGAFSFAFVGDPQIGASGNAANDAASWDNSLNEIASNSSFAGISFMLSAGDQVNTASNEEQYSGYLNHDTLLHLPVATIVGNHDSSSVAYDEHFNVPNESNLGATAASRDYYFVYNNVLFMMLNSNNMSTAEHKQFMEEAIAATADQNITWKIVSFHHSIFSVASHAYDSDIITRRNELVPVFKDLDVDVVLMGHDHVYCRTYMMDGLAPMTDTSIYDDEFYSSITNPEGILYVTANSASGSKFYNIKNETFDYSAVQSQENIPCISRVDISDTAFTITTYQTVSTGRSVSPVDAFTIYREAPVVTHTVTVYDGTASAETAPAGEVITLTAGDAPEGMEFDKWVVEQGAAVLADETASTAAFEMPDEDVVVRAAFKDIVTAPDTNPDTTPDDTTPDDSTPGNTDSNVTDTTPGNGSSGGIQISGSNGVSKSPAGSKVSTPAGKTGTPNTGDSSSPFFWVLLAAFSGAIASAALFLMKLRRRTR